jgi:transposase
MSKLKEVLRLKYLSGLSNRQIQTLTGVSKSAISNYATRFEKSGVDINQVLLMENKELGRVFYPELKQNQVSQKAKRPLPEWSTIHNELKQKGMTKLLLWQEYKESHPDGYGYSQFKEYYARYIKTINPSMRQVHYAGDKLFIDFSGLTVPIANAITGEVFRAQIFVATLGASGYTFIHAVSSQSVKDFIECHNQAFNFYGGVPNIIVPDNLKAAVISNKHGKVKLNESYADMGRHYNIAIVPTRTYHPQDKSKVEVGVKGIQRWILMKLRHHTFFDLDELNDALSILLDEYNNKCIKKIGKSRTELFNEIDKSALHTLASSRYQYKEYKCATVGIDYHIELEGNGYSVPYEYKGKKVDIWYSSTSVNVSYQGDIIASHIRQYGFHNDSTKIEHMPKEHQFQHEKWNPGRILNWAASIGVSATTLMKKIMENRSHPVRGYKSCMAILNFSKHYPSNELELVCKKALEINAMSVVSIEAMLKRKTYLQDAICEPANNNTLNNHANIRGSSYYQ